MISHALPKSELAPLDRSDELARYQISLRRLTSAVRESAMEPRAPRRGRPTVSSEGCAFMVARG